MSLKFFADLRETFVELKAGSTFIRTANRKEQMTLGLKEAVALLSQDISQTEIVLRSCMCETYWREKWFPPIALVTTEGFQQVLEIETPQTSSPFKHENSFGLSERTYSDGSITKDIKIEELNFIHEKLKLSEIKAVVIGFLHSNKNSKNEETAKRFFLEHGYCVETSSSFSGNESEKFLKAAKTLSNMLVAQNLEKDIQAMGFKKVTISEIKEPGLYALEDQIVLVDSQRNELRLALSPYSPLFIDHLGTPQIKYQNISSEPGPVCFGKGVELTVFDVLALKNNLQFNDMKRLKIDLVRVKKYFQLFAQQKRTNWESLADDFIKLFKQLVLLEIPTDVDINTININGILAPYIFDTKPHKDETLKVIGELANG